MAESVYKVIELVGTSTDSWEKAASAAVDRAGESLRDLRVAEIVQRDDVDDERKPHFDRALVEKEVVVFYSWMIDAPDADG